MKVLFCGDTNPNTTSSMRRAALQRLGHQIQSLHQGPYVLWGGRYGGFPFRRLLWGPPLWNFNRDLLRMASAQKPDLVWMEKALLLSPRTLERLKKAGAKAIHYTPDPAFFNNQSRHFEACAPFYDLVVTTKSYELDQYRNHGFHFLFQQSGYDATIHRPLPPRRKKGGKPVDVLFVGRWEKEREGDLLAIHRLGLRLEIWGPRFHQHCRDRELMESCWKGPWLMGDDYARAVANARVTLCFLSKLYPDQTTQRTFEIPASGGFMLAERTEEHLSLFGEGREAAYFSGREELLQKVRYYLDHEGKRKRIAAAALRRCRRDGYRYDDRIQQAIDLVFKKTKSFQKGQSS